MTAPRMYRVDPAQHHAQLRAAAVIAEAVCKVAMRLGADTMVHDEVTFSGPNAHARAAEFERRLHTELDICTFEHWQAGRRAYNRMMAAGLRMLVEGK